jgi:hypothetical protein
MSAPAVATRQTAWYRKARPTFTDALALVGCDLWRHQTFPPSLYDREVVKVPRSVMDRLTETLCHAD